MHHHNHTKPPPHITITTTIETPPPPLHPHHLHHHRAWNLFVLLLLWFCWAWVSGVWLTFFSAVFCLYVLFDSLAGFWRVFAAFFLQLWVRMFRLYTGVHVVFCFVLFCVLALCVSCRCSRNKILAVKKNGNHVD